MTLDELDRLDAADHAEADRLRRDTRTDAIMGAPEAEGRQLLAFALLLRLDISPETAVLYLREAPPLRTVEEVGFWVEAIPLQPDEEVCQ